MQLTGERDERGKSEKYQDRQWGNHAMVKSVVCGPTPNKGGMYGDLAKIERTKKMESERITSLVLRAT